MQNTARLSSASKKAIIRISKEVSKSSVQIRGKSSVSSVENESLGPRKIPRRLPKQERRARVISFINKYRALNDGKTPGLSIIQEEVGGGFYTIREIVQEILYKQKTNHGQEFDSILSSLSIEKNENEQNKHAADATERESAGLKLCMDSEAKGVEKERVDIKGNAIVDQVANSQTSRTSGKRLEEVKEGHKVKPDSAEISQESRRNGVPKMRDGCAINESKKVKLDTADILQDTSKKVEPKIRSEYVVEEGEKVKINGAEILHASPEKVEVMREQPQRKHKSEKQNEESSESAGQLWGNLKSLADGFINFWKKF